MSDTELYDQWLDDHYEAVDDADGPIHVFSRGDPPSDGSILWYIEIFWNLFGINWGLQGNINLETLYIDARFFFLLPILIVFPPVTVQGSLLGDGVKVPFILPGFTQGWARFYAQDFQGDQYLYVELFVERLFRRILPPRSRIVRLRRIPRVSKI